MFNQLTPNEQAALLLTTQLSNQDNDQFTTQQYHQTAQALRERDLELAALFWPDQERAALEAIAGQGLPADLAEQRVKRGFAFALAVTHWSQVAIRIVSHLSDNYPQALSSLEMEAPPFIFVVGNPDLEQAHHRGAAVRAVTSNLITTALNRKVRDAIIADRLTLAGLGSPYQTRARPEDAAVAQRIASAFNQ